MTAAHKSVRSYTWDEVRKLRMQRSLLADPPAVLAPDVARTVSGIHAQVMSAGELSLAMRTTHLSVDDVREALWESRTLVKAWTLRGTLHLHPADELPLWVAARRAVSTGAQERSLTYHGVTRSQYEAITDAIGEALDGACLSRKELAEAVASRVGSWAREPLMSAWGTMLGAATLRGWLCHGPSQGTTVTFARADQWIKGWSEMEPHEALRTVARRYVSLFGPVGYSSFHMWFNGPTFKQADARKAFESLGEDIQPVDVDGMKAWALRDEEPIGPVSLPAARILPLYDCYLVGFREREFLLTDAARAYAKQHPKGKLEGPVAVQWLLVDGLIDGTWEKKKTGKKVLVTATPFSKATKATRAALEVEAVRLSEIWGAEVDLSVRSS